MLDIPHETGCKRGAVLGDLVWSLALHPATLQACYMIGSRPVSLNKPSVIVSILQALNVQHIK